jgi:hypothetical protein
MFFEELAPRLPGGKWGRGLKRADESAREDVRFGDRALATIPSILKCTFKDHALTDEFWNRRTQVIHALAGGARGQEPNCGLSPCLQGQKAWRGG